MSIINLSDLDEVESHWDNEEEALQFLRTKPSASASALN